MFCPKCKEPINNKVDRKAIDRARELHKRYSVRDIAILLHEEGWPVYSHTQIWTLLKTKERQKEMREIKNEQKKARRGRPAGSKNRRKK